MSKKVVVVFIVLNLFIIFGFQNCGSQHPSGQIQKASLDPECEIFYKENFETQIHGKLSRMRCTKCHTQRENVSQSYFADSTVEVAYNSFSLLGASALKNKIQSGHKGVSYSSVSENLESFEAIWTEAEEQYFACANQKNTDKVKKNVSTAPSFFGFFSDLRSGVLCGADFHLEEDITTTQKLNWNLQDSFGPAFEGVSLSLDVNLRTIEFPCTNPDLCTGKFYCVREFYVSNPMLSTGDKNVYVQGIDVLVDGDDNNVTTFSHIDKKVPKASVDKPLSNSSSSGLIKAGEGSVYSNETEWKINFKHLEILDTIEE